MTPVLHWHSSYVFISQCLKKPFFKHVYTLVKLFINRTQTIYKQDSKKKDQADEVFRNPHPVMTTRIWLDSKNENDTKEEPETISPGRELLGDIGGRVQEDIVRIDHNSYF